jgi:hypothetical protein
MESIQEVSSMLAKTGSFYYKNLSPEGMSVARKLTQLYSYCRILSQFKAAGEMATSAGYYNDFGVVIHFTDKDVDYYGAKDSLQVRPISNSLTLKNYTALADSDNNLLTEVDRDIFFKQVLAFPDLPENGEASSELEVATRDSLQYGLYIDKDTFVSTITTENGELLLNGVDFVSCFGLIVFKKNPIALFPGNKFVASSLTRRCRNILSFVLGVDVYGPIDRIVKYYREAQSPKTFYLAAAQSIGMCVTPDTCIVYDVEPLHKGYSYVTSIGKLDAPYAHTAYSKGDIIGKDTVIGGSDLFSAVLPGDSLPSDLGSVSLDHLLPVSGLSAPNKTISISSNGKFNPAFEGDAYAKNKYVEFLKELNDGELPSSSTGSANAIAYARSMASNRCLILRINKDRMYGDMQLSLDRFIERELPIGVVLLRENMVRDF